MKDGIHVLAMAALAGDIFPPKASVAYDPALDSLPEPVRIAERLRQYLLCQPVTPGRDELLSCGMRFDGSVPSCIYQRLGHENWASFFWRHSDYQPDNNPLCFLDWNHFCTDYEFIVNQGITGYLPLIERSEQEHAGDRTILDFLAGLRIVCEVIGKWAANMAREYENAGRQDIARICRKVPYRGAESFHEAVQSVWSAFLFMPDSLGRLDQVLYPFYRRDTDSGVLDEETAYELICELFVKVFAFKGAQVNNADRSGDNSMVVGGYTPVGEDGFNALSALILKAVAELPTWRPQVSFRWTKKTPFATMEFATKMNIKKNHIVLTSDEERLKAFSRLGIPYRDAVNYTIIGCNEWAIAGKSNSGSDGFFNPLKSLVEVLHGHGDELSELDSFDGFYGRYERLLARDVGCMMDLSDEYYTMQARDTNVLSSLFIDGCIEKGLPVNRTGARYNASCWSVIGLANLADSLSVINDLVYERRLYSLSELSEMLKANWQGHEHVRARILREGRFYGNDDDGADGMMLRAVKSLNTLAKARTPKKGGTFVFGSYVGYNSAHITMGRMTGATPDGRHDGEDLAAGLASGFSKDRDGMTAFLKSAAKIDFSDLGGPLAVNLKLDKGITASGESVEKIAHVFESYFRLGGVQLQPDYLSAEELIRAQRNPDAYQNLRVRVTGFSGFFVRFDKDLQNEIIARTQHRL